jgi:hypothetical protein
MLGCIVTSSLAIRWKSQWAQCAPRACGLRVHAMESPKPERYRIEIWEIKGRRFQARIWPEAEWNTLPREERPVTAMLVHGIGWVDLASVDDEAGGESGPGDNRPVRC